MRLLDCYCERTPPNSIKIHNPNVGSCCNLEIEEHRATGTSCKYCKYMKIHWNPPQQKEKEIPVIIKTEPELTDLELLDLIGE